jgi:transposase
MNLHLEEISRRVAPNSHAAIILDGAGYHKKAALQVPENITLVPLPPYSPELSPVENIWEYLRGNKLANIVFKSYEDIVDHCCSAWNRLIDQPWHIISIGMRDWAHRF